MIRTCTQGEWNVGTTRTHSHPQGYAARVLSVFKFHDGYKTTQYGDGNNKTFFSDEEYNEYCLTRGYTQRYYDVERSVFKKTSVKLRRNQQNVSIRAIKAAKTQEDIVIEANRVRDVITEMSGDISVAMRFSNGVYVMASHYRPDLDPYKNR